MSIQQLSSNAFTLSLKGNNMALVTFSEYIEEGAEVGKLAKIKHGTKRSEQAEIMYWGNDNLLPQHREKLIGDNNIVGQLINTKRNILLGDGLKAYRRIFENGVERREYIETPTIAADWFEKNDMDFQIDTIAKNVLHHANTMGEYIKSKDNKTIAAFKAHECRHLRAEKHDSKGRINNYYYCSNWEKRNGRDVFVERIPGYNQVKRLKALEDMPTKFIYHTGDNLLYDDYYFMPAWWGGRWWITLSNCIPLFHRKNITQGYSIRYHIEVPFDYFKDFSIDAVTDKQKAEQSKKESDAREEFMQTLNEFLSGIEGAGKTVFSFYEINKALGKEFPGIKIKPLNVDLKDEAMLKLFEKSNEANMSAQGVHPTLAAIQTQGKLSSGSEIRNAYIMYTAIHAPVLRNIICRHIHNIKKLNGWDKDVYFGFRDVEMTSLDQDRTGQRPATTN